MEIILIIIGVVVLLPVFSFIIFYIWGSSQNMKKSEYDKGFIWKNDDFKVAESEKGEKSGEKTYSILTNNIGFASGLTNNRPIQTDKKRPGGQCQDIYKAPDYRDLAAWPFLRRQFFFWDSAM